MKVTVVTLTLPFVIFVNSDCYTELGKTLDGEQIGIKLLGEDFGNLEMAERYSAEKHVTKDTPPAFIWHTMEDATVPVENSLNLAAAYSRAGVSCEMHIFPEGRHGLGLCEEIPHTAQWTRLLIAWLDKQGYLNI